MSVNVTKLIRVEISGDRPLVLAFSEWALEARVYSERGFGTIGPDFMTAFYALDHQHAIDRFLTRWRLAQAKP